MEIKIKDLRTVFEILMKHQIEYSGKEVIVIGDKDFYWDIPLDELYNPYNEPKDLTLGQLSDDWNELQRIIEGKADPVSHDVKRLGVILNAISAEDRSIW